jgi:hypothetical protein
VPSLERLGEAENVPSPGHLDCIAEVPIGLTESGKPELLGQTVTGLLRRRSSFRVTGTQREALNKYSWNGLADSTDSGALSNLRAVLIRNALIAGGLEQSRVRLGNGDRRRLLCSEGSESCWQQNRRVEVVVAARAAR